MGMAAAQYSAVAECQLSNEIAAQVDFVNIQDAFSYIRMKLFTSIALLALLLPSGQTYAQSATRSSPQEVAKQFYRTYLKLKMSGIPDEKQFRLLSPLLTPELGSLLKEAEQAQAEYAKKYPENKPPWTEGDLFSSVYEGATSFSLAKAKVRGKYAEVPAHLEYNGSKPPARWTDILVLKHTPSGWRVDNVCPTGEGRFKNGGGLRQALSVR